MNWPRALSPFTLAGVPMRNRIFLPAHTTNFARDFLPTPEHVAYLRERAKGGVALVMVEPLRVHPTSLGRSGGLSGGDRRALDGLRRIVDAVRGEGAAVFCQITHAGRHGENAVDRLAAWGPSAMPWVVGGEMPHAMTRRDMDAVRDAYVETAGLALEAGFQGMEIHLGHGHLLHQFLSPAANSRPDDYGGSLENRLRYPLEVLGAVTAAVGSAAAVGIRVSVDDLMPDGLTAADQQQVVAAAVQVPGVAFVNASVAAYQWPSIGHHVADMSAPPHPYLAQTVALRDLIGGLPLLTANRYQTLDHAETALEQGVDMVGMNRAHMADPDLIAKATSGRGGDIRPCVSGNFCIGQVALHRPISCMMNPRVGREERWPEYPAGAQTRRRVLVVGAGPAGMEAARVAAFRGHAVALWDAGETLGGKLVLAASGQGRADLRKMRDWLAGQLVPNGVTIRLGFRADAAAILAHGADAVVLATGAVPDALPDAQSMTVEQALADPTGWDGTRVVIDDHAGSWATLSAAETLVARGARVTVVCRPDSPLWDVTIYSRMTALERLAAAGVALRPATLVTGYGPGTLHTRHKYAGDTATLPFDRLVFSGRGTGAFALQSALEAAGAKVHPIGDANAPRTLFEAMHDAAAIARSL
jgi:2,4-dienoyl-CoA reductase-like NADH-dependent reductase (Old Yellow Enzyme family)